MDCQLLKEIFFDLLERLDQYYDNELMQDSRARKNLEYYKKELMQELAVEVYANYDRTAYKNYDPTAYIWLKAEKVWIRFTRRLNRVKARDSQKEVESLAEEYLTTDLMQQLEMRNTIELIEQCLAPKEITLIRLRSQGLSYEEIRKRAGYSSANAAKEKFYRIKKYILSRFNRH
jgi:DNA-directed RNA polymerase specialized sigma24 family protein